MFPIHSLSGQVLGFGACARLLEPAPLVAQVRGELAAMSGRYAAKGKA